jgi:hypothetical protein
MNLQAQLNQDCIDKLEIVKKYLTRLSQDNDKQLLKRLVLTEAMNIRTPIDEMNDTQKTRFQLEMIDRFLTYRSA